MFTYKKAIKEAAVWIICIVVAILFSKFLNTHVLVNAKVLTGSMESTIMTNHRVFGLRTPFLFTQPNRGDIIVFSSPLLEEYSDPFIKRIIALPSEQLSIISGVTYINGTALPESYIDINHQEYFETITVPYGKVFVMGDNRRHSRDSREWGAIEMESIIGRIYLDFSPLPTIIANYVYAQD